MSLLICTECNAPIFVDPKDYIFAELDIFTVCPKCFVTISVSESYVLYSSKQLKNTSYIRNSHGRNNSK